jgi:hypothetical protein
MKKTVAFLFFVAINTFDICYAHSPQDVHTHSEARSLLLNSEININWTRATAQFNRLKFLEDADKEHNTTYLSTISNNENIDEKKLNEACWNSLNFLENLYESKNDYENLTFTYQAMAKFLLTFNAFPDNRYGLQRELLVKLIDNIGRNVSPELAPQKHNKIQRWFHIYEGMLFLKYAKEFASDDRRARHIANAYHEFTEASKLKTTKTSYLLAAEAILDYNHTPENMTRQEAEKLAYEYIEIAHTKTKNKQNSGQNSPQEAITSVEKHAQPTYMHEIHNTRNHSIHQYEEAAQPQQAENKPPIASLEDELADYDFTQLVIPQNPHSDLLPIRNRPQNTIGDLQERYIIDNKTFRRQNVSGRNMRCFFNAIGLNPEGQIALLSFFANDPISRTMIANEIISASDDPDQLPEEVKSIIEYDNYYRQRDALNRLELRRNTLLRNQSLNPDDQHPELLPEEYQNLNAKGAELLENLRRKALSLQAYNAFIEHHIGNEAMMVSLLDVQNNGNNNYTSIDAIAYLNNIGIHIYQSNRNGTLRLAHQYIPEAATEIAYLYHQGAHFQALIPSDENDEEIDFIEDNDDSMNFEPIDATTFEMPSTEELTVLYPDAQSYRKTGIHDVRTTRKVLYLFCQKKLEHKNIGKILNIDRRIIGKILNANGKYSYFRQDIKEDILHACLESYDSINNATLTKKDLARAIAKKLTEKKYNEDIDENKIYTLIIRSFFVEKIIPINQEEEKIILDLYLNGETITDIHKKTEINIKTVLYVLSKKLDPNQYINPMNLNIDKENKRSKIENLVIQTFKDLKKRNNNIEPSIYSVYEILKKHQINYKTCTKILKKNNLIAQYLHSKYLPIELHNKIKSDFDKINPKKGEIKKTSEYLAEKYNVTFSQVNALLHKKSFTSEKENNNYKAVVAAYNNLTPEEKQTPCKHIKKRINLNKNNILKHLKKAGLYQWNGKKGPHSRNLLAENNSPKITAQKRKREEDSDTNPSPMKKRK